jgi:hypothetical protein
MKKTTEAGLPAAPFKKLSEEDLEAKRLEVSKALNGARVHLLVFEENEEDGQVVGFLKEPNLNMKIRVLDNIGSEKLISTGSTLLESIIIKEYSDSRIYDRHPDHDQYYLGATTEAIAICKVARNVVKKKPTSISKEF